MPEPNIAEANIREAVRPEPPKKEDKFVEVKTETKQPEIEPENNHPGLSHLNEEDRKEILALRKEAADRRVKAKEIEQELNKMKREQQKREEERLIEEGKIKELLDVKEKEIETLVPLREKVSNYEQYFQDQLEIAMGKLTETQKEFINDSDMTIEKKLKWAIKFSSEGLAPAAPPDSVRPGGKAPTEKINISEYLGPVGRIKLVELKKTNPNLFDAIVKEKQNLNLI